MRQLEIVIASGKGGVGKSLISAELSLALLRAGYAVVAVDADADAPNLHLILGNAKWEVVKEYNEGFVARILSSQCVRCGKCAEACPYDAVGRDPHSGAYVVNELLCEGCAVCSLVCPVKAVTRVRAHTGIVRAGRTLIGRVRIAGAKLRPGRPNSGRLVTEVKALARQLWGGDAEVFIVDAAAGIGCQVIASLAGASAAVLVAEPTPASLEDLRRIHRVVKHFGLPAALVINKSGLSDSAEERIIRYAEDEGLDLIGKVPYDDIVPKSIANLTPVTVTAPDSDAGRGLRAVRRRIIERVVKGWDSWKAEHAPTAPEPYVPEVIPPPELTHKAINFRHPT